MARSLAVVSMALIGSISPGSIPDQPAPEDRCELALAASPTPRFTHDELCDPASTVVADHLGRAPAHVQTICTPGKNGLPPVLLVITGLEDMVDAVESYVALQKRLVELHAPLPIMLMMPGPDEGAEQISQGDLAWFEELAAGVHSIDF